MRLVETSIIVRYLVQDVPDMAERATAIIEGTEDLVVTDLVLAETAHVLLSVYQIHRQRAVDALLEFISRDNIGVLGLEKALVQQALLLSRPSGRVSIADALIWAAVRQARINEVYSFDERFPDDGLTVLR